MSDGATVLYPDDLFLNGSPDPQIVIEQAFKSGYWADQFNHLEDKQIWIDLKSSKTVEMVDVINYYGNEASSERMGRSAFYITDNVFAT